jgi:hypothetical protein
MKWILITALCTTFNAFAFFKNVTIGAGTFTEHTAKIYDNLAGDKNTFELNPYIRLTGSRDFYFDHDLTLEISSSLPYSSRDSDVSKINYWTLAKLTKNIEDWSFHYGGGFYFTRMSMDGKEQTSTNAGVSQVFQTPEGAVYTTNNVLCLGLDYHLSKDYFFNLQSIVLNVEDSLERSFNYSLSFNYNYGVL